tara:strand:+ start:87 stop:695 length:609 start_codon:yes stop_codon:yes gene_type:complete
MSEQSSQRFPDDRTKEAYHYFVKEFSKESDRAAVILGAAKLDILLYQILVATLKPSPTSTDALLDGDSPLSTFSSRINLCHRLGLIDDQLARALNIIRKIRNSFAHEISSTTLSSGSHSDRIRELLTPFSHYRKQFEFFKSLWVEQNDMSGPSGDFRVAIAVVGARLETTFASASDISRQSPITLVPQSWDTPTKAIENTDK